MVGWVKSYDVSGIFAPEVKDDYITFVPDLKKINEESVARSRERMARYKAEEPAPSVDVNYRPKTWLIATTKVERAGTDTALSHALQAACIKKMQKDGHKPWEVIAPIIRKDAERREREAMIMHLDQIQRIENSLIFTKPITDLMQIANENQWMWNPTGGYWMRYNRIDKGVNRLHTGKGVGNNAKAIARRLERADPYGLAHEGGVRCG